MILHVCRLLRSFRRLLYLIRIRLFGALPFAEQDVPLSNVGLVISS